LRIKIQKIVDGGYGFSKLDNGICLVPYSVPGDVLDIEGVTHEAVSFGWIKKIVYPSEHRRIPLCPVFGKCGGCDFDHIDYNYELEIKKDIILEDLSRIAKLNNIEIEHIVSSKEYGYRNHAQFKVDENGNLGFFARKSHEVVILPESGCLLLEECINNYILSLKDSVRFTKGGFRIRCNNKGEIFKKGIPGIKDDESFYHYANDIRLKVGIDDFFQINNNVLNSWLYEIELYLEPNKKDKIVDLFCGCGLISLFISRKINSVVGIEISKNAIKNARQNAVINNINNTNFIRKGAFKGLSENRKTNKLVVDPPRTGLSKELVELMASINPEIIVYASCNPATFSRDIKYFKEENYILKKISLVDMFPRTKHLEIVAKIVKL